MRTNEDILEEMHNAKNHAANTRKKFRVTMQSYCKYQNLSLYELLEEADTEEDAGIRWKKRSLKRRLLNYRKHLLDEKYSKGTIRTHMANILTFYRFFDIELQRLPAVSYTDESPVLYKQLPTKEILRKAVDIAKPRMKAIIVFMSSSGCARTETLSLTINEYVNATREYHNGGDIVEILNCLDALDDIVPTFNINRKKTGKYYTTFCSPEAVHYINDYLRTRPDLSLNKPLFDVEYSVLGRDFNDINDKLRLGKIRGYNRLRSHMLRKFHASALYNDGMPRDFVNDLQGKKKNTTDQSYFFVNEDDLKAEYINHLHALQIMKEVERVTVKSKEFRELEIQNIELSNENTKLQVEVENISSRQDNLEKILLDGVSKDELGKLHKIL